MLGKNNIDNWRAFFSAKVRDYYSNILFEWILPHISQPLAVSGKATIVFAPHQDDETFGCGGVIAMKSARGIPIKVVFLTDGRLSIPDGIDPKEIINIRQQEAINALNCLGVPSSEILFLNQIDGSLKGLSEGQRKQLILQLSELLTSFPVEEIYLPHHRDCHPDHEATYSLVQEAVSASGIHVELWQYLTWILWQNPFSPKFKLPEIARAYKIPINTVQEQKKIAIASYSSQTQTLPPGFIKHFFSSYEIFVK